MMRILNAFASLAFLMMNSCLTEDKPSLDLSMNQESQAATLTSQTKAAEPVDWQSFFRRTPSASERNILARRVVTAVDAQSPEDLKKLAERDIVLGQLAAAQAKLEQAYRLAPTNADYPLTLAELSLRRQQAEQAFDYLSSAKTILDLQPRIDSQLAFRYRYVLALAEVQNQNIEAAKAIFTDLIRIDKGFTPAYLGLANIYLELQKTELAQFILMRAIDRAKPIAGIHNTLGVIARQQGQLDDAISKFRAALKLDPYYAPALINLAGSLYAQGDLDAAESNLKRAVSVSTSDFNSFLALASCQKLLGQKKSARLSFERALELNPESARARLELAQIMNEDFKDPDTAIRLLREAVQIGDGPTQQSAKLYLNDLLSKGS